MLFTERFSYFQCKNMFKDFLSMLSKSISLKLHTKDTNLSVTNSWEQAEIHWNLESFQELVWSHPSWHSLTPNNTKFWIYMVWGCINCNVWACLPLFCQRYGVNHFHFPLPGPSGCQLEYHDMKVGEQTNRPGTECHIGILGN